VTLSPRPDDETAFAAFYDSERLLLARFAALMSPHVDHAAAVHDAFTRTWLHWPDTDPAQRRTRLYDEVRALLAERTPTGSARPEQDDEDEDEPAETLAALVSLPEEPRAALVLRMWDLDDAGIAALLGCEPGAVRDHLVLAWSMMRELLGTEGDDA
jgi:RNA polymerase sigma-70 factor (ECF subfamily)